MFARQVFYYLSHTSSTCLVYFVLLYFYYYCTGVWTQGLFEIEYARQVLCHLNCIPSLVIFEIRSWFMPGLPELRFSYLCFPQSWDDSCAPLCLTLGWAASPDTLIVNFFAWGWPQPSVLPISALLVAGITKLNIMPPAYFSYFPSTVLDFCSGLASDYSLPTYCLLC
jgi:hypothetical protein